VKNAYYKFIDGLNKVYLTVGLITLMLMVLFCTLQVASRYIPNFKFLGMEELARMMFVWTVALGFSVGVSMNAHARVDLLFNAMKGKLKLVWGTALEILFMVFFMFILITSIQKMQKIISTNQVTPLFNIPMKYLYLSLVVGSGGAVLNAIRNIISFLFPEKALDNSEV
jgi:C4-dicarboxylate transporter DctQ subunit